MNKQKPYGDAKRVTNQFSILSRKTPGTNIALYAKYIDVFFQEFSLKEPINRYNTQNINKQATCKIENVLSVSLLL